MSTVSQANHEHRDVMTLKISSLVGISCDL